MPVINASAGLANSLAQGAAQGIENYVGQRNQQRQMDQDDERLAQLRKNVELREAELGIRKAERQRILGERQAAIEMDQRRIHRAGATNVGAAAVEGAMQSGVDPMNPMFWGYAGKKILDESQRMATEVMEFESLMQGLPENARRELGQETMARMAMSMQTKQDKLRRYGAAGQINEWLSQNPDDAEAFVPLIQAVHQGQVSPESALSQLMERQSEVATRQVAQQNAMQVEALGQSMIQVLGSLGSGTSKVAQAAIAGAKMRVAMGGDVDASVAAMLTDMLSPQVQRSMVDGYFKGQAIDSRSDAAKQARRRLADDPYTQPPGYDLGKWTELSGPEKVDVWTLYYMGQDWTGEGDGPGGDPAAGAAPQADRPRYQARPDLPFDGTMFQREPMNLSGSKRSVSTGLHEQKSDEVDRKALSMIQSGASDDEIRAYLREQQ